MADVEFKNSTDRQRDPTQKEQQPALSKTSQSASGDAADHFAGMMERVFRVNDRQQR